MFVAVVNGKLKLQTYYILSMALSGKLSLEEQLLVLSKVKIRKTHIGYQKLDQ
jgi:hypothetical protein